jgi:hypothetical protein
VLYGFKGAADGGEPYKIFKLALSAGAAPV